MDLVDSPRALRRWALANLVANIVIIWTGALVRLTRSGLGCPTWPRCTADSFTTVPEQGWHGVIEFGNRLLTFVLVAIAIGLCIASLRAVARGSQPRRLVGFAAAIGLGIIAQAIIGGISVRMQLNPWVVGLHMLASAALVLLSVEIVHVAYDLAPAVVSDRVRTLANVVFGLGCLIIVLGIVVTGSGPNAGDGAAQRNGLDIAWTAKVHAWAVWLLVALTAIGVWWSRGERRVRALFVGVLACELLNGLIGYIQYFTHLPWGLVLGHMVGTSLFLAALAHLWRLGGGAPRDSGVST